MYLATASTDGQPYVQHRGGPKGFLKVIDPHTLAFADFAGNQQYISIGNLSENDKAFMFLMDYVHRRRVKLWGQACFVEDDPALLSQVTDPAYGGTPQRVLRSTVLAWDVNCTSHIAPRHTEDDIATAMARLQAPLQQRIAELESNSQPSAPNAPAPRIRRPIEPLHRPAISLTSVQQGDDPVSPAPGEGHGSV